MADTFIQLNTDGTGKKLDTRTEGTNSEHRQVFVLGDPATNAGVAPVDATKGLAVDLTNTGANTTAIKVDNSAVTQPVSGTFWQATQPVSATSLPLPTGSATSANQTIMDGHLTDGTQKARLTDGTNETSVLKSDGTAAGQNAVMTAGAYKETTGLSAGSLNADLLPSTDMSGYQWLSLHITGTYSGTLSVQYSNDNFVNVGSGTVAAAAPSSSFLSAVFSATGVFMIPKAGRYVRVRMTAYTSGTANAVAEFYTTPPPVYGLQAIQGGTWTAVPNAATTGGTTLFSAVSAATTNATSVKASAGQIYKVTAFNIASTPRYLKIYNKASSPTVGTDVPVDRIIIPGNTAGAGVSVNIPVGDAYATGIALAITAGIADSDTTAVGANEVTVNIGYK